VSEFKKCPKCRGKMIRKTIEVETSETGVPYWRIPGIDLVAYICNKCGYAEIYDKEKVTHEGKKPTKKT
jgi:predicted nucleic-acid-binding Zn-ribbon protein